MFLSLCVCIRDRFDCWERLKFSIEGNASAFDQLVLVYSGEEPERLSSFRHELSLDKSKIKIVENPRSNPAFKNWNDAIFFSDSQYSCLLFEDDFYPPESLCSIRDELSMASAAGEHVVICCSNHKIVAETGATLTRTKYIRHKKYFSRPEFFRFLYKSMWISATLTGVVLCSQTFRNCGGFQPVLNSILHNEDFVFSKMLQTEKSRVLTLPLCDLEVNCEGGLVSVGGAYNLTRRLVVHRHILLAGNFMTGDEWRVFWIFYLLLGLKRYGISPRALKIAAYRLIKNQKSVFGLLKCVFLFITLSVNYGLQLIAKISWGLNKNEKNARVTSRA